MFAPTPCIEPGCKDHAKNGGGGRCLAHKKPWVGSTRKQRLPGDWNTRRTIVLRRDKGICYLCQEPGADTVDHVTPGDDHSLGNLKAVHDRVPPHCHRYKTSKEALEAQRLNRIKPRR